MFAGLVLAGLALAEPAAAQNAAAGAIVYKRCAMCHAIDRAKPSGLGPNLAGVVGRKAGSLPKFAYSKPMAAAGFVWDKAKLDAFLARPQAVVKGTRMAYPGLPSAKDRADVIAFMQKAR